LAHDEKAMPNLFTDTLVSFLSSMSLVRQSPPVLLNLGFRISDEIVAFGLMIEPLFVLISEFENRKTQLFMRERLLAKCYAWLRNLVHKYEHIPDIASCSYLLRAMTFLRLSKQNHQLSLMAKL
jgi:hypothetical protein